MDNTENTIAAAGGFDLNEWKETHMPDRGPDRRPAFFRTVRGRLLVFAPTRGLQILAVLALIALLISGRMPPLSPSRPWLPSNGWFWIFAMLCVLLLCELLHGLFARLGWADARPKAIAPSSRTAVEGHYGVDGLTVADHDDVPVVSGLYPCTYLAGGRACSGVLRVDNGHVWLYGPDGAEQEGTDRTERRESR